MYLSPSFSLNEFVKSGAAIRLGLDNTPPPSAVENLRELCLNVLQPIRNKWGLPVVISSGYRSANLNHAVGGSSTSLHLFGQAADIEVPGVSNAELWRFIRGNLPFDQLIAEYLEADDPRAGWIHVSYKKFENRKQALSCVGGAYVDGLKYVD